MTVIQKFKRNEFIFSFIQDYIIRLLKAMLKSIATAADSLLCSKIELVLRRSLSQLTYTKIHSSRGYKIKCMFSNTSSYRASGTCI
jgi:hypothetical protein